MKKNIVFVAVFLVAFIFMATSVIAKKKDDDKVVSKLKEQIEKFEKEKKMTFKKEKTDKKLDLKKIREERKSNKK